MACFGGMGLKQQQAFRTAHLAYWPLVASEERFNELYAVAFRALEQVRRRAVLVNEFVLFSNLVQVNSKANMMKLKE